MSEQDFQDLWDGQDSMLRKFFIIGSLAIKAIKVQAFSLIFGFCCLRFIFFPFLTRVGA